ncbi:MAG: hypothetical protein AVDCRST_MAG91-1335, partial [uncultured Sphingomonadaceae bacterium]
DRVQEGRQGEVEVARRRGAWRGRAQADRADRHQGPPCRRVQGQSGVSREDRKRRRSRAQAGRPHQSL